MSTVGGPKERERHTHFTSAARERRPREPRGLATAVLVKNVKSCPTPTAMFQINGVDVCVCVRQKGKKNSKESSL